MDIKAKSTPQNLFRCKTTTNSPQIGCKQIAKALHVTSFDMTCPFSSFFNYMLSNAIHNLDFVSDKQKSNPQLASH